MVRLIAIIELKVRYVSLQGDTCPGVANNPLKYAQVEVLIFHELRPLYDPGHKVKFLVSCSMGPSNSQGVKTQRTCDKARLLTIS
jgi:hypothetical protein